MKSSPSAAGLALATAFALALSLGLKVMAGPPGAAPAGPSPEARIGRILTAASAQPPEPVDGGWRVRHGDCWMMAFPSGPLGTLDIAARSHARKPDRVAYVYKGRLSEERPTMAHALDVIGYHLQRPFRTVDLPSYVVLVAPKRCGAWPALPWERLA